MGSTIKPYVYTLAMENGFSPCDQVRHVEQTLIDEMAVHGHRVMPARSVTERWLPSNGAWQILITG